MASETRTIDPMFLVEAKNIMKEADYSRFEGFDSCCLDGWFSAKQLEAALVLLKAGYDQDEK